MQTSQRGVDLVKQFEGLELEAYQDIAGIWTIGYGHTGPDVQPGQTITQAEAEELLRDDLVSRERAVDDLSSLPLNQNEFDALVSFVYNVGANAFRGSTARKRLNRGDRLGAADALTWWNKATINGVLTPVAGLTRRRAAERALFLAPVNPPIVREPTQTRENSRIAPVEDPPRRGSLMESRTVQGAAVAGGAGVASTSVGRDNAEELNQIENNIESGRGMVENPSAGEGDQPPRRAGGETEVDPDDAPPDANGDDDETTPDDDAPMMEMTGDDGPRPAAHEAHEAEAQLQFALMILILAAVAFIIFARIDDWFKYRR